MKKKGRELKKSIPKIWEREGNEKSIPEIREQEGNEKIHSQSSGMGIRGLHSWEWPGTGIPAHPCSIKISVTRRGVYWWAHNSCWLVLITNKPWSVPLMWVGRRRRAVRSDILKIIIARKAVLFRNKDFCEKTNIEWWPTSRFFFFAGHFATKQKQPLKFKPTMSRGKWVGEPD